MSHSLLHSPPKGVVIAHNLLNPTSERRNVWCLDALAGRYVEIAGGATSAALTAVRGIFLEAQRRGELVAWIGKKYSTFYPPDFAAAGVDLAALLVVFAKNLNEGMRVADVLFRSGAFGVLAFDMAKDGPLPMAAQSRFVGLAKEHHVAFLEMTSEPERKTLGSLASLRVTASKKQVDREFHVEVRATKDKLSLANWRHTEICHGPDGLC